MRERLFKATGEPPDSTRGECPAGFISVARLTIDLSRLSHVNRQLPKQRNLYQKVIGRLVLSAIVLVALATPVGVVLTLDYMGRELTQKMLEGRADFYGSPVP